MSTNLELSYAYRLGNRVHSHIFCRFFFFNFFWFFFFFSNNFKKLYFSHNWDPNKNGPGTNRQNWSLTISLVPYSGHPFKGTQSTYSKSNRLGVCFYLVEECYTSLNNGNFFLLFSASFLLFISFKMFIILIFHLFWI